MTANSPHTFVLAYLTPTLSATRTRRFAVGGTVVVAVLHVLLTIVAAVPTISSIRWGIWARTAGWYYYVPPYGTGPYTPAAAPSWSRAAVEATISCPGTYACLGLLAFATLATFAAIGLRRSARWACILGVLMSLPIVLAWCMLAAALFGAPLFILFDTSPIARTSTMWLAGVLVPITGLIPTLLALLTLDLIACQNWIRRNPVEEMPKRKFLS